MRVNSWNYGLPRFAHDAICKAAERHQVTPRMILSGSHERRVVEARRDAIIDLRYRGKYTLSEIGKMVGGIHHSSVKYHLDLVAPYIPQKPFDPDIPDLSGEWAI